MQTGPIWTDKLTIGGVCGAIRRLGLPVFHKNGEFCVDGYFTDDREDALETAVHMAIENRIRALGGA